MLWQGTADDLVAYGAKVFYPKFTNRHMGASPLHLGTREIQLVLLKNALLLGVSFSYGAELVGVQAPDPSEPSASWRAWAFSPKGGTQTHQTAGGVLDFKPNKQAEYSKGAGMGACNMVQATSLDATFVAAPGAAPPDGAEALEFDALVLAEGEWSNTCKRLGFTKNIDKFSTAIGLVINMVRDPLEPKTKDPNMRSFTVKPFDPVGKLLTQAGVGFEFAEYLKGETHYIVVTIKKATLLKKKALREDKPGSELLTRVNLDEAALMVLSREIATIIGLPETTAFCDFHGAKLFDFSTRARCAAPFRVLGVMPGGAQQGTPIAADLEAHPYLSREETKFFERQLSASIDAVKKCDTEVKELEEAIQATSSNLANMKGALNDAADEMVNKVQALVSARSSGRLSSGQRRNSGVQDDEWEDDDALPNVSSAGEASPDQLAAQRRAEYGVADVSDANPDVEIEEARLEAYKKSMIELEKKREVQQGFVEANEQKQAEWLERVDAAAGGMAHPVPIFPVGDAILEPFWPQGLGSNRGFHSALDAVWCTHVLHEEGLEAAMLERNFWYDLLLLGPWNPGAGLLKNAEGWRADPMSRYADGAVVRTKQNYTNPQSKRLFRGDGATPPRIAKLELKGAGFL